MRAHQTGMFRRKAIPLLAAFVAGFFLVGLPHWLPPYDRYGFAEPAMISALAGLAAIAMMLVVGEVASPRRAWLTMSLCLPAAVLARAVAEGWRDIGPLEFLLAIVVGGAAVLPGALAGAFSLRLQSRGRG